MFGIERIGIAMFKVDTLNIAIPALSTSTSTTPLGTSSHNKNFFEAGYHSNEIPVVILG